MEFISASRKFLNTILSVFLIEMYLRQQYIRDFLKILRFTGIFTLPRLSSADGMAIRPFTLSEISPPTD